MIEAENLIKKGFYAFRGFIEFSKQLNLFNEIIDESTKNKNKIFISFFDKLESEKNLTTTTFKTRKYLLLFYAKKENIVQCKLARKHEYDKDDLEGNKLVKKTEQSYPNVSVFVDLKTQKFLVESKIEVFENYNTCIDVIKKIMDDFFQSYDSYIAIESIVNESHFWNAYDNNIPIYSIEFKLNSPNLFNGSDRAEMVMKEVRKSTRAEKLAIKIENNTEGLTFDRDVIDSYVKYSSSGGGSWSQKFKDENGRTKTISSKQVNQMKEIIIEKEINIDGNISEVTYKNILNVFTSIETVENLK